MSSDRRQFTRKMIAETIAIRMEDVADPYEIADAILAALEACELLLVPRERLLAAHSWLKAPSGCDQAEVARKIIAAMLTAAKGPSDE